MNRKKDIILVKLAILATKVLANKWLVILLTLISCYILAYWAVILLVTPFKWMFA